MKRFSSLFITLFFIIACQSQVDVTETIPTNTAIPEITLTSTQSPTVIPQALPTATKDPNAPAEFTRVENGIYYLDANDGYTYTYFIKSAKQEAYWARPLIENYYAYDDFDIDAIPMDVWVKLGTPGSGVIVGMTHRGVIISNDLSNTQIELNTFMLVKFQMTKLKELRDGLNSGIPFDFIFNGEIMSSNFGKNGGFQITIVSEDELKLLHEQGKAVRSNGTLGFVYLVYDGVENGRILVRVASSQPLDKLLANVQYGGPEYELRKMIFLPLMNILITDETDDLINVAAMRDAGIVASASADPRSQDGRPDLQILIRP